MAATAVAAYREHYSGGESVRRDRAVKEESERVEEARRDRRVDHRDVIFWFARFRSEGERRRAAVFTACCAEGGPGDAKSLASPRPPARAIYSR